MYNLYELSFFFIIYAILGWCLEVVYEAVDQGKFINRGFLNGPYCPIYGVGVIIVTVVLNPLKDNIVILYLGSVILTTVLEFVTGFVLEKIFAQKWWDYSNEHFNIKGYICLKFSLLWGVACLITVRMIHPLIERFVRWIPHIAGIILLIILFMGFLSDFIITVLGIMKIKKRIKLLEGISIEMRKVSDRAGEKLYGAVEEIREKNEKRAEKNEEYNERFEELKKKYKTLSERQNFVKRRIEKAFPRLKINSAKLLRELLEEFKNKNME